MADKIKHALILNPNTGKSTKLMFSKKSVSQEIVADIDLALALLKSTGEYQEIIDRSMTPND